MKLYPKNAFSGFCQNFLQAIDEVKILRANFQILGPLGCQGWVVIPENVKKPKSLHPNVHMLILELSVKQNDLFIATV